jgi:hypothetical protein
MHTLRLRYGKLCLTVFLALVAIDRLTVKVTAQEIRQRPKNELFEFLVGATDGTALQLDEGAARAIRESGKLLPPQVSVDLPASRLEASLDAIFGEHDERERYFRKSIVAPQILKLEKLEQSPDSRLRIIHFWFIAYGELSRLEDEALTEQMISDAQRDQENESDAGDHTAETRQISTDELAKCGVSAPLEPSDTRTESYSRINMHLFKKIDLDLTMRMVSTRDTSSILSAAIVDPRFNASPELKNTWRRSQRNEAGELQLHSEGVYADAGGYVQLLQLSSPSDAVLVEGHFAFLEPHGWFDGANLLSSKMPIMVQMSARRLRRSLLKTLETPHDQP